MVYRLDFTREDNFLGLFANSPTMQIVFEVAYLHFVKNCQHNDFILEFILICFSLAFVNHNYHYHTVRVIYSRFFCIAISVFIIDDNVLLFFIGNPRQNVFNLSIGERLLKGWHLIPKLPSCYLLKCLGKFQEVFPLTRRKKNFPYFPLHFLQSKKKRIKVIRFKSNTDIPESRMTCQNVCNQEFSTKRPRAKVCIKRIKYHFKLIP